VDTLEPESISDLLHLFGEALDPPQRMIIGAIRAPTPELVVEHDGAALAEHLAQGSQIVVPARGTAMEHEQRDVVSRAPDVVEDPPGARFEEPGLNRLSCRHRLTSVIPKATH
jgi:hypothetical protein